MYFDSFSRDYMLSRSIKTDDLIYHYPRRYYLPIHKNQIMDRNLSIASEYLRAQTNSLYLQMKEQQLAKVRSATRAQEKRERKKVLEDDIWLNKLKIQQHTRMCSSTDKIFKQSKDNSIYHNKSTQKYKENERAPRKEEKTNNVNNIKYRGLEKMEREMNKGKGNQSTKSPIFNKLDSNESEKASLKIPYQQGSGPKGEYSQLEQQIYFLKQQLREKNKIILDLQCEMLKKQNRNNKKEIHHELSKQLSFVPHNFELHIQSNQMDKKLDSSLGIETKVYMVTFKNQPKSVSRNSPQELYKEIEIQANLQYVWQKQKFQKLEENSVQTSLSMSSDKINSSVLNFIYSPDMAESIEFKDESEIDFTLSASIGPGPQSRSYKKMGSKLLSTISKQQSLVMAVTEQNITDTGIQTEIKQSINQQCQTSSSDEQKQQQNQ